MTGSAFSTNVVVHDSKFTLHGSPKHYTFVRGSETHTTSFCGECGTTVSKVVEGLDKFKGHVIVEAGTLNEDEGFNDLKVTTELYVKNRAGWLKGIEGAHEVETL